MPQLLGPADQATSTTAFRKTFSSTKSAVQRNVTGDLGTDIAEWHP